LIVHGIVDGLVLQVKEHANLTKLCA